MKIRRKGHTGPTSSATACASLRYPNLDSIKFWTSIDTLAASAIRFWWRSFFFEREKRMSCDVDTGAVFKHPVHCFGCDQAFYFTLRKIAEAKKLACPQCGSDINLTDEAYGSVVTSVKQTIALIDQNSRSLERTRIAPPWTDISNSSLAAYCERQLPEHAPSSRDCVDGEVGDTTC
jgi:hypothetical protein